MTDDLIERLQDESRRLARLSFHSVDSGIASNLAEEAIDEIERLRAALIEIRDHWANQYDHPRKENAMYRGSYGIGVTDGHRACTIIAERALAVTSQDRGTP